MGYYSDFRVLTTVEGRDTLEKYVRQNLPKEEPNLFSYLDVDKIDKEKNISFFGINQTKFERWFPEVSIFLDGLQYLKGNKIPYKFIRLGEDPNDIEFDSCREIALPAELCLQSDFVVLGADFKTYENDRFTWIIGICGSESSGVYLESFEGTEKDIKSYLAKLVSEDVERNIDSLESATTEAEEINYYDDPSRTKLYGWASFEDYHIEYSATKLDTLLKKEDN